eukprot:TRINITY_DN79081_c0_g1_i1.p1 TRINITY_DN79081_c0_g1~~TRINITY_DN79081_c0_g1_i1.p1  ORF type:complete len:440 (-),score=71.66 TRINITY_DN79081_c0_g1_i1:36-1331(-)
MSSMQNIQQAEAENVGYEPYVLPVFYYNDFLISAKGHGIALNLFEPRYQEMCRRMTTDPRFLFMPNFTDYTARSGDVGFIVKLTSLRQSPSGSYGIQGVAEEFVTVLCCWVEPEMAGLHHALVHPLDSNKVALSRQEADLLYRVLRESGWQQASGSENRDRYFRPEFEDLHFVFGSNWPDRCFAMAMVSKEKDKAQESSAHLGEAWNSTLRRAETARGRFSSIEFQSSVLQFLPPWPEGGVSLRNVCEQMASQIRSDAERITDRRPPALASPDDASWFRVARQEVWHDLLLPLRVCCVSGMSAVMPSVRLELAWVHPQLLMESLPRLVLHNVNPNQMEAVALLNNESNVYFYARPDDVEVTAESAAVALKSLTWRLNRLRLSIVERARMSRQGFLGTLEDDAARHILDFVAEQPLHGRGLFLAGRRAISSR